MSTPGTAAMNPEDLRYFLAIRLARSIKGAARMLKVDHSTVSRRLSALEEALAARLFERTPEGLLETDAARAIAPLAEQIELLTRELQDAARAASDAPAGPVRLAVSPLFADHFLMPRVPELLRRLPDVELDIRAEIARANIVRREADIAIRQHPIDREPAEPAALAVKVARLGFAAYASRGYLERYGRPAHPVRSLAGHKMISTGAWAPGDAWNAQLEYPATYSLSVYPFSAALAAALAGLGIAVLPCLCADADARLVRLSEVVASFNMWAVTNAEVRNNARVRAVKDALVEMIRAGGRELAGEVTTGSPSSSGD